MIMRAMGLGFLLWLAVAAAFRFGGQYFFLPDESLRLITFLSAPVVGVVLGFVFLKLLGEARGDEGEASIGLALPVLLLNGFLTHEFANRVPEPRCHARRDVRRVVVAVRRLDPVRGLVDDQARAAGRAHMRRRDVVLGAAALAGCASMSERTYARTARS